MHEAACWDVNCFLTLTYRDECLPLYSSLDYRHFQLFMKRLRRRFSSACIRFYMCGEYGSDFSRPHFHVCLFNFNFPDRKYWCVSPSGQRLYRSKVLEELWPVGNSTIGAVTFQSAAYVARYCVAKMTGRAAESWYEHVTEDGEIVRRTPEFNHMSLKPGIGSMWLERFARDVYPRGKVVVNGREAKPPRFYDRWYKRFDPDGAEALEYIRFVESRLHLDDQTEARLKVREQVAVARFNTFKRELS